SGAWARSWAAVRSDYSSAIARALSQRRCPRLPEQPKGRAARDGDGGDPVPAPPKSYACRPSLVRRSYEVRSFVKTYHAADPRSSSPAPPQTRETGGPERSERLQW